MKENPTSVPTLIVILGVFLIFLSTIYQPNGFGGRENFHNWTLGLGIVGIVLGILGILKNNGIKM